VRARPPTRRTLCSVWLPRLRRALPDGLVDGLAGGYRLTVEPDAVDAARFERLVGQARHEEDPGRVALLREAPALWRGAAMRDVALQDSAAFDAAATRLERLRLTAIEDRFDPEVGLGHGVEVGRGADRRGGRASGAGKARRCADACPWW
jgi:Bacterial transcriptional activator domain